MRLSRPSAAIAIALIACTDPVKPEVDPDDASLSAAGGVFAAATAATDDPLLETKTVSVGLDRIDQRGLPLDHRYRRRGTGRGVTVYVFDGGILPTHPELAGRVRKGYDAYPSDVPVCNAHGTAVAGAIAGKTLGVAPEAEVVDVKMLECSKMRGSPNAIVEGARWVIEDHLRAARPAIANWSFIADTIARIPALDSAVRLLRAEGIAVIVSAGNVEINACRVSPANAEGTIVVGSSTLGRAGHGNSRVVDRRVHHTAYGPCVNLFAPGDSVLLPGLDSAGLPNALLWSGTSMATGYVSGAAALFLESTPAASPDEVLLHLQRTATLNVVHNTGSPLSWLLYVGPVAVTLGERR